MKRAELVEHMAWIVRGARDVRKATLDLLSELDRSAKWRAVAARVPDGGRGFREFLDAVERRVVEIS